MSKPCVLCGDRGGCNSVLGMNICDVHQFQYEIEAEMRLPPSQRPLLNRLIRLRITMTNEPDDDGSWREAFIEEASYSK